MNNLASLFATPTPAHRNVNIPQAKAWASKALEIVTKARESYVVKSTNQLTEDQMLCEETVAVVLFNLGMLSEMGRQEGEAMEHYERALRQSETIGMDEGVAEAKDALKRLRRKGKPTQHT
ncbi:hypothetical protein FRC02_005362 [Tulasnella sp. 418]|nr:hypothetical protein FRC02_005362 [Tulasnella sp. 418]